MTLLVALVAYALGAKQSEVTFLGAIGACEYNMRLVLGLVSPWLLDVSHYGGGMGSGRLHMTRFFSMCTCHHLGS